MPALGRRRRRVLADAAERLEGAGADALVLCTNTMHKRRADPVEP